MLLHDGFDCLGGFVGVIKRDCRDVVVQDVGFNNAVEEVSSDEAEISIDGSGGAASKCPRVAFVVWEGGVGVLEEGDCD